MYRPTEAEVLGAADSIVEAFSATDTDAYFAGFADDASFVFHTEPRRLESRGDYERLWRGWVDGGWRVTDCRSDDRRVQVFPGGAVFSHTVATSVVTEDRPESYVERETIVFAVTGAGDGTRLVAVHEHLSALPGGEPEREQS